MADTFSAKAILSAQDKNFTSTFKRAEGIMGKVSGMASSGLGFGILAGVGQAAFGTITSGAKQVVGSILETGMSFESATSQIAATMGKPKEAIADVIKEADRLGKTTAFTATEAAEGMNILAMAGMDAQQQIGTAANVLNLASAGAESMDAAASQVVGTMKGFSMAMSNAEEAAASSKQVADLLAKGASLANTNVNQLGTALSQSAASASTYGQSIKSTEVALLRLAEQNVTGAEASTALNRAMMDLYTPTSTAAKALKDLGVSAYTSEGKARDFNEVVDELNAKMEGYSDSQKNALKNTIFSTFGLQAFNKMCVSSKETVDKFSNGLDHASDGIGSAADMAATQLDNLQGDMTLLSSAADGLKNTIYGSINSPLRSVVQTVTELTTGFDKFLSTANLGSIAGQAKTLATAIGAVAVANGGLGALPAVFGKIDAAGALMTDSLSHAPGALAKAFKTGYSKLPGIVRHEFSSLRAIGKNYTDMVKMDIGKGLTEMIPGIGKVGKAAGTAAEGIGKGLKTGTKVGMKTLSTMTSAMGSIVKTALMSVGPAAVLGIVLAGMGLVYSQFRNQIDEMIRTAQEKGPETITKFVDGITSRIPRLVKSGAMLVRHLLTAISANLPALFEGGVKIIDTLVTSVGDNVDTILPAVITLIGTFATGILNAAPQLIMTGLNLLLSLAQGIVNNLPLIVSTAVGIIQTLVTNFQNYLPQILTVGIQILMTLAQGAIAALPTLIVAAIQGITCFINTIAQNLPTILQAGVAIIGMLISGIVQNLPAIISAAAVLLTSLIQGIAQNLPAILTAGLAIIGQLVTGIIQALPDIVQAGWDLIKSLGAAIAEAIPNVITGAVEGIKGVFGGLWDTLTGQSDSGTSGMASSVQTNMAAVQTAASTAASSTSTSMATINDAFAGIGSGIDTASATIIAFPAQVETSLGGLSTVGTTAGTGLVSSLTDSMSGAVTAATGTGEEIVSSVEGSLSKLTSVGADGMSKLSSGIFSGGGRVVAASNRVVLGCTNAMRSGFSRAYAAGAYIGQGLANGINAKVGAVRAAAARIVSAANAAIEAKARIGSPSKITTQYGKWYGDGYINGVDARVNDARRAAEKLISFPKIAADTMNDMTFGGASLQEEAEFTSQKNINIVTYTQLDGKTIARSTAKYTEAELDKRKTRKSRKEGVA